MRTRRRRLRRSFALFARMGGFFVLVITSELRNFVKCCVLLYVCLEYFDSHCIFPCLELLFVVLFSVEVLKFYGGSSFFIFGNLIRLYSLVLITIEDTVF